MAYASNDNFEHSLRKLALVTGASIGIGYELAMQFARHGYDLLIITEDDALNRAAENLKKTGVQVEAAQCDLASFEGREELGRKIAESKRSIDAAALNAGVGVGGKFIETDLEEELNLIQLNVVSTVHLAKLLIRDMAARGKGGKLLFTSSIAATLPGPCEAVYAASRAFILSFSENLRHELTENGITVTALMPGPTETNVCHRTGMDSTKAGKMEKDDPAQVAKQFYDALMEGRDHIIAGSQKPGLRTPPTI